MVQVMVGMVLCAMAFDSMDVLMYTTWSGFGYLAASSSHILYISFSAASARLQPMWRSSHRSTGTSFRPAWSRVERTDSDMKSTPRHTMDFAPFFAMSTAACPIARESAQKTCSCFSAASVPCSSWSSIVVRLISGSRKSLRFSAKDPWACTPVAPTLSEGKVDAERARRMDWRAVRNILTYEEDRLLLPAGAVQVTLE